MSKEKNDEPRFGFYSVVAAASGTFVGGYLILNALGRPLEFHCTEPIKPTRAQEILYGQTLTPFLFSEQIGRAITAAAKIRTDVVFVDSPHSLELRSLIEVPVACVVTEQVDIEPKFQWGDNRLAVSADHPDDASQLTQKWASTFEGWDLAEPFARIHEAISEAQKAA